MICIDSILMRYPHPNIEFIVRIGSDCSSVLDTLWISSPVITILRYLHQVIREIFLIKRRQKTKIIRSKIWAYQDDRMRLEDLSQFKLLNVKCDSRAKFLIQQEERETVPFSFELSSPYLSYKSSILVLNTKESMLVSMSVLRTSEYISRKL